MSNVLLVVVVVVALGFDFTNGFHDTANYIATWVGTRALSPRWAVLVSAAANLAGAFVTTAVAKTVGKGIIDTGLATETTVLAALVGAIAWNLLTWWLGLPSSSTHALIGGLVGAALVQSGSKGVQWHGIIEKVVIPGAISPAVGFAGALPADGDHYRVFFSAPPGVAHRGFRLGQLVTGTWVAFTHGANDAQKTMGVIALALVTHGNISHFYIPTWVKIAAGLTIAAGTYAAAGGSSARSASASTRCSPSTASPRSSAPARRSTSGTHFGFPISTTHVVTGSVMGAGAVRGVSALKWGIAGNILTAWLLTLRRRPSSQPAATTR